MVATLGLVLDCSDPDKLGADALEEFGNRWEVMADPESNEFCVCSAAPASE